MYITSGTISCEEGMTTVEYKPLHSQDNNEENKSDDYVFVSSPSTVESEISSEEEEEGDINDDDYFAQFSCPEDSDDDLDYFYNDDNDDLLINNHLNHTQLNLMEKFGEKNYQRSKRSNKKMHAQCQIKTKHARTIQIKSHNKELYIHHRILKKINLDPPKENYIPSPRPVPLYSNEALRSVACQSRHLPPATRIIKKTQPPPPPPPASNTNHLFPDYIINEHNIPTQQSFDDAMIAFLLDMQNRDLSPEDYEMLLRLDERVQRKTVDTNILNTLPTIIVTEAHLNDQCTICIENYLVGQELKLLPCKHMFHVNCIETYLKDFSTQCPLDNLPLT